jgi:hypothetical protein
MAKYVLRVLQADSAPILQEQAQDLIDKGFMPVGPATAAATLVGYGASIVFTMTLVKEEPTDAELKSKYGPAYEGPHS